MVNNIAKECFSKSILLLTIANLRTSFSSDGRKERITIKIQWTYFLSWDISQDSSWPKPIVVTCVQKTSFSDLLPKKTIESPLEFNHPSSHLRPAMTHKKLSLPREGQLTIFNPPLLRSRKKWLSEHFEQQYPIRAERQGSETRHWEHPKMYLLELYPGPTIPPARPALA